MKLLQLKYEFVQFTLMINRDNAWIYYYVLRHAQMPNLPAFNT
jgi:hypothetical protein